MITKKKLHWIKNGTEYSAHLITSRYPHRPVTPPVCQLAVQIDGQTLYTDDTSVNHIDNMLSFKNGNYTRYVKDVTPIVTISSNITDNPIPYNWNVLVNSCTMKLTVGINNKIELQYSNNSTWTTFLELPADSTYVSLESAIRVASQSWRIKIGSWTSTFTQYTGDDTTTRNIPEAQWGV